MNHAQATCTLATDPDFRDSFAIHPDKHYLVHNRTPDRIRVVDAAHGEVWLAPLAQRVFSGARLAPFEPHLRPLRQAHQLRVREYAGTRPSRASLVVWAAAFVVCAVAAYDLIALGTLLRPEVGGAAALFLAVTAVVLVRSFVREDERIRDEEIADTEEGDIEFGVGGAFYDGNETVRSTKQSVVLTVVVIIGAILPAVAILVATDANDFLVVDGGLRVVDGMESRLVGRLVQVVYTAVLSLFPALMYFQFDRQRVGTIRGRWVRNIFRMDRQMKTLADVEARYGDELAEASSYSTDSARLLGGRHSPIVVATILISLGWTLLVMRTESFDFAGATRIATVAEAADQASARARDAADQEDGADLAARTATADAAAGDAAAASDAAARIAAESTGAADDDGGSPPTTGTGGSRTGESAVDGAAAAAAASADQVAAAEAAVQQPYFQLLVPTPSAATMAFLGAYFFAVYLVLRGYFRGDLRPKLYNQIAARLVTMVVLAYLMNVLYADSGERNQYLWVTAFLAGVVPSTFVQRLEVVLGSALANVPENRITGRGLSSAFATQRALTRIDGIDIYDSSRLESEGITDIPSLAKSDLVATMVTTRLPVERIVDWTDQAMLLLLLDDGDEDVIDDRVRRLRAIGIRTASDLATVAHEPGTGGRRDLAARILGAADAAGGGSDAGVPATDGGVPATDGSVAATDGSRSPATGGNGGGTGSNGSAKPPDDGEAVLQGMARQIEAEPSIRRIRQWRAAELKDLDVDCPVLAGGGPLVYPPPGASLYSAGTSA